MTAAEPREIRLSEIPTELRNLRAEIDRWREAHARELTRAEALERGLKQAREARDAARKTCDDLTDHCTRQGRRIADLEAQLAELERLRDLTLYDYKDYRLRNMTEQDRLNDRIDTLELSVEAHAADATAWMRQSQANFGRADKLAEYIEHELEHKGETVADEHVRDLVIAAGIECPECEGKGWEADEDMIPFGGASNGYRTRAIVVDCERCSGVGRVLR